VVFKKIAATVSAVAFVMLAVALGPNVPTALSMARASISKDVEPSPSAANHSCAAFEVWFLNPGCRPGHVARTKQHLTQDR
jgi:hypothetical protein